MKLISHLSTCYRTLDNFSAPRLCDRCSSFHMRQWTGKYPHTQCYPGKLRMDYSYKSVQLLNQTSSTLRCLCQLNGIRCQQKYTLVIGEVTKNNH